MDKGIAALLAKEPAAKEEPKEEEKGGKKVAAQDVLDAIEAKSVDRLKRALQNFVELCK